MIYAGIDAGSRTIKVVLIDGATHAAVASAIDDQGVEQARRAERLLERALAEARKSRGEIGGVVATGYGRDSLEWADRTVTEITCQGQGVLSEFPDVRTIIDIGGQDSKLLRLDGKGHVMDFVMNDRCAAGTGRFLEVVAARLELGLAELGPAAFRSATPASVSSMCVVFAESEIVGLLAAGGKPDDIVAGVQRSIAERVGAMAGRRIHEPVVLTGGVALVTGMDAALAAVLGVPVAVSRRPQFTAALGAALLAAETD